MITCENMWNHMLSHDNMWILVIFSEIKKKEWTQIFCSTFGCQGKTALSWRKPWVWRGLAPRWKTKWPRSQQQKWQRWQSSRSQQRRLGRREFWRKRRRKLRKTMVRKGRRKKCSLMMKLYTQSHPKTWRHTSSCWMPSSAQPRRLTRPLPNSLQMRSRACGRSLRRIGRWLELRAPTRKPPKELEARRGSTSCWGPSSLMEGPLPRTTRRLCWSMRKLMRREPWWSSTHGSSRWTNMERLKPWAGWKQEQWSFASHPQTQGSSSLLMKVNMSSGRPRKARLWLTRLTNTRLEKMTGSAWRTSTWKMLGMPALP